MRNSENSSTRSKFAAVTRIGLLVLIFAVVFATVLSCGAFGESASLNNGSVENVAEAIKGDVVSAGGNSAGQVYAPGWPSISTIKQGIYASADSAYTFDISLSSVSFENAYSYVTYNDGNDIIAGGVGSKDFYANGRIGSFGGMANESSNFVKYDIIAATNVKIEGDIISFISDEYDVSVKWKTDNLFYWDDANAGTYMGLWGNTSPIGFSSKTTSQPIPINNWNESGWQSVGALNKSNRDGTLSTSNGDGAHNKVNQSQSKFTTLPNTAENITLAVGRDSNGTGTYGVGVSGITLTFKISVKSGAKDEAAPVIQENTIRSNGNDQFNGLILEDKQGFAFNTQYTEYQGVSNSDKYNLTTVTSVYFDDKTVDFNYYKSFEFTVNDGKLTQATYSSGIQQVTLQKTGTTGSDESVTVSPGKSDKYKEAFRLDVSAPSDAGTTVQVKAYFAESGTYGFTVYDKKDNDLYFEVKVGGIDLTPPSVSGSAPDGAAATVEGLDDVTWRTLESNPLNAYIGGNKAIFEQGNSAWFYFFDVSYSFFKPSAPTALSDEVKSAIKQGDFLPIAVSGDGNPVYFSYNPNDGGIKYGLGSSDNMQSHTEDVKPLSGYKTEGKPGYYTIMIYAADVAGNVGVTPFVYYLKVDNQSVSGVSTSYKYDTDGQGTSKTSANGWVNQYMVGADGKVYVDISFKLNPSGNIVTFGYGGNYYEESVIEDAFDFTATVTPVSADVLPNVEIVEITGGVDDVTLGEGKAVWQLVSGVAANGMPRAALSAQIGALSGSGADWTVTLTLIYSRGGEDGTSDFGIDNSNESMTGGAKNSIGVVAGCGGSASPATVDVKVDTKSLNDFAFSDNYDGTNTYLGVGDFDDASGNGGINIDTSTVYGRKWFTSSPKDGFQLYSDTLAYNINEYLLSVLDASAYKVYFGWEIYTADTVNADIAADLATFKSQMESAKITGLANWFVSYFTEDDDVRYTLADPSLASGGSLLASPTGVNLHLGPAGVRVLYIMTLDQAGNANFSLYYLFVDTTTYTMTFEVDADYVDKFSALGDVTLTAQLSGDSGTATATTSFKRGDNVAVTFGNLPSGYIPYTVSKFIGSAVTTIYRSTTSSTGFYKEGLIQGTITTPADGDFASGQTIAFVLDQAGNLGRIGTEDDAIGLRFAFRMSVNLSVVTSIPYNGYALTKNSNDFINVTSSAVGFGPDDIANARAAAYAMIAWSGYDNLSEGLPINVGKYEASGSISFIGDSLDTDNKYYISNRVSAIDVEITKRALGLDSVVSEWTNATYGDIKTSAFADLSDEEIKAITLAEIFGAADLGQDDGKSLADILTGSDLILVNGYTVGSAEYNAFFSAAGNLNAGAYTLTFNSDVTAQNYSVTLGKSFTVAKKTLNVTATGSKTYGSADGNIVVSFGDSANLCGDSASVVFPGLNSSGATSVYLPVGTSSARNYTYENQGTDNYTDVGTYSVTSVNIPSANLSSNFAVVLTSGTFEVKQLTVYVAPDEGQKIYSPTDYNITFSYYYSAPASGSAQEVVDARILEQIVAGAFQTDGVPQQGDEDKIYDIVVRDEFSASTGNVKIEVYIGGRTVELVYNWDTGTFTISVKNGVTLSTVYGDLFDNSKLLDPNNFTVTYDNKSPISGQWELTWTAASLSGYDTSDVLANGVKSYSITIANDAFQLIIDDVPQTDLSSKYNFNVVASASVTQLEIKITPSFGTTEKTYGYADAFVPTFTANNVNGSASNAFVFDAGKLSGNMVRALFGSDGKYVRVGASNDPVTAPNGGYYGAYVTQSYTYDSNVKVTMDNEALNAIRFIVKAREIRLSNTPGNSDVTAFGKNKEVPTGTADVNYAAREPFTISNLVAGDDVYIAYTTALYVKKDDSAFTDGELNGTAGDVTDLNIKIAGLSLAGDAAANYVLVVDGGGMVADFVFVIVSENKNEFIIYAYKFSGIKGSDVSISKVYDGSKTLADENYTISGELKKVQDQFSAAFEILGIRLDKYVYVPELGGSAQGQYNNIDVAFFVEGLSSVSFEGTSERTFMASDYKHEDKQGVVIVVFNTSATITQRPLSIDEIKLTPDYTARYYNGTNVVSVTFAWADSVDPSLFTVGEFRNLNLRATFTLDGKDAGDYTGIKVSALNYNASSNFAPTFKAADIESLLADKKTTINPIPLNVTFAFVAQEYGAETTTLDGENYRKFIDSEYQQGFVGWEAELDAIAINTSGATFTYSDADGNPYPYVQYDLKGSVRLHDISYEGVTFTASGDVVLGNYTFQGSALTASSSGVIEAIAALTPKQLTFNTGAFVNIEKIYDGTVNANATLQSSIEKMGIAKVLVDSAAIEESGLVNDDATKLTLEFTAVFDGVNVGTGRNITISGIALVANNDDAEKIAMSYVLTKTTVTIQNCTVVQAPLQVVFTLPTKSYDGTNYVDSVNGVKYYVLGGERGDFATASDRSNYRVTFVAAAYDDVNANSAATGKFYGVELTTVNSSTGNYYLVDADGNRIEENFAYGITDNPDAEGVVARYKNASGSYEYIYVSPGSSSSLAVVSATGVIEKAVYDVNIVGTIEKEFDNTDVFDFTSVSVEVVGLEGSGGVTITSAKFESVNVGTWIVTFELSYTGAANENYTVSETATAQGTIKARELTVSVEAEEGAFVYGFGGKAPAYADYLVYALTINDAQYDVKVVDGVAYMTEEGYKALAGADATLPKATDFAGVNYYALNGTVGTVTLASDAFKQTSGKWANAGNYAVTGISATADNFTLVLAADTTVTIDKAVLTVNAKGDYDYVVDTAIADLEALVLKELVPEGITNGDNFASVVSGITVSFNGLSATSAPASSFAITVGVDGVVAANYTVVAGADEYSVTVVLPELVVTAKSGQSSIYDGTDKLDGSNFLAELVNYVQGDNKTYTFSVDEDVAIVNAGRYVFYITVTRAYTGLEGYVEGNEAYTDSDTVEVTYDVNKAALTVTRSGKVATVYYNDKEQRLTDYTDFFVFEGAVAGEESDMILELASSATYNGKATFKGAGAYEVALNATEGVFANYNVTSGVTLLNVRKAPVMVNGNIAEGDINSGDVFGVIVTGVVPAANCQVPAATVAKLGTTVAYSSGATSVSSITAAGVYNYVITLSDSANYEIVTGGSLDASGTVTVTVKVVTETDGTSADKKSEVVFETPQTKNWTLNSYEIAETNNTYVSYSNEIAKLAGSGQTAEIGGVIRLELVSGTTTINATSTGKLSETVEISVKLPSALGSSLSGYTVYERQKDGSLKEVTDYVVNDGYLTYNSNLISDLVFAKVVGSGVPIWIWILIAVLAALIILAIILAAFIGRKDRGTTPPPAAPPAEPTPDEAPVSHEGALPAADVDIDIPDAPAKIGGGDRPPLIGTR